VVVDPGVLVSAALSPSGNPARIVEAIRAGHLVLVVSETLLAELNDVLARPRLAARLDATALRLLRGVLEAAPVIQDEPAQPISRDPKDDYLISLARSSGADFLISGDQDLTDLVDVLPPVMAPAAFVARLES